MSPILQIQLNTPKGQVFFPGNRVSGHVLMKNEKDEDVECVLVRFYGKASVSIPKGENNRHNHKVVLFDFTQRVFKGPFKLRAGEHTWQFSFVFPERCDRDCKAAFNEAEGRFVTGPQLLPPTSQMQDGRRSASIEYKLRAKIPRTFMSWKIKKQLVFSQFRVGDISPNPRTLKGMFESKYRMGDDGRARALKTRESLSDTFHSHTITKNISINIELQSPTSVIIGERLNSVMILRLQTDEKIIPEIFLTDAVCVLKAITNIRAPGLMTDHHDSGDAHYIIASKHAMKRSLPLNTSIELNEILPIMVRNRLVTFPDRYQYTQSQEEYAQIGGLPIPPSFQSYNQFRIYHLEYKLRFVSVNKEHSFKLKLPVTIYAEKTKDEVDSMAAKSTIDYEELPPMYNHADATGVMEEQTEILPAYAKR